MAERARGRGEHMASERRLEAADRQRRALELRKAGKGFDAIAAELGYDSRSGAHKAVMTGLKATLREPAEELRTLELERLDALLSALWPVALQGDQGAVDRVLRVMERRSKYLGLDTTERTDLETLARLLALERGLDPDAAVESVRRAAQSLREGVGGAARSA
jgi:hypothetical protein